MRVLKSRITGVGLFVFVLLVAGCSEAAADQPATAEPAATEQVATARDLDRAAIEDLVENMAIAIREADIPTWYEKYCSPAIRDRARATSTFETYLREPQFDPTTKMSVQDIIYAGTSSATVIVGFSIEKGLGAADRGTAGFELAKVDDAWYNNGLGCNLG